MAPPSDFSENHLVSPINSITGDFSRNIPFFSIRVKEV